MFRKATQKTTSKFYEKYKPCDWFYVLIIVVCAAIRFVPLSSGSADLDDALNDFAIGAGASTWATWLLATHDCSQKNKQLAKKKELIFSDYKNYSKELCYFVARRSSNLAQNADERSFSQWLYILSNTQNYKCPAPQEMRKRSYLHLTTMVKAIKVSLTALQQQYAVLVESDIIDTNSFHEHASAQIFLCDDICDCLEINDYSDFAISEANDLLKTLVGNIDAFFPDLLPNQYTWKISKS